MLIQAHNMAMRRTSELARQFRAATSQMTRRGLHSRAAPRSNAYPGHPCSQKGARLRSTQEIIEYVSTGCMRDQQRQGSLLAMSILGVVMAASFVPPANQEKQHKTEISSSSNNEGKSTVKTLSSSGEGASEASSKPMNRQQLEVSPQDNTPLVHTSVSIQHKCHAWTMGSKQDCLPLWVWSHALMSLMCGCVGEWLGTSGPSSGGDVPRVRDFAPAARHVEWGRGRGGLSRVPRPHPPTRRHSGSGTTRAQGQGTPQHRCDGNTTQEHGDGARCRWNGG